MRKWWLSSLGAGVVVLTLLAGVLSPAGELRIRAEGEGEEEQATAPTPVPGAQSGPLWELAERLLLQPYSGASGETPKIQLLPGQLPGDLPLTIPIPSGGRLVGSAVRTGGSGPNSGRSVDVVLDAPGSSADVVTFFQQALASQGWTVPASMASSYQSGGFQQRALVQNRTFCQGASGPWLMLNVYPRRGGPNDVRLNLNSGANYGPCSSPPGATISTSPGTNLLPPLYLPDDVTVQTTPYPMGAPARPPGAPGSAPAFDEGVSSATAETAMSVTELEASIAKQLTAAGWTRRDGRSEGALAWSLWTVPGQNPGQGFLYVLEAPGSNRRTLYVRAEAASSQPSGPVPAPGAPPVPISSPPAAPPVPAPAAPPPPVPPAPPTPVGR